MKVLALTNLYPNPWQPHRAPYNRHQFRMLGALHALQVIAPIAWTDEWSAARRHLPSLPHGRRVTHDGLIVDHPRYWYTPKFFRGWYGEFFLESIRSCFRRALSQFQPDVIFAPWAYPDGYAAAQLAREAGLPVVIQVHGSDIRLLKQFPSRAGGTRTAVRNAHGVIAVSRDLAAGVVALGAKQERVRVIIDGVERSQFTPGCQRDAQARLGFSPGKRHLLFVGNLAPVKGVDVLLTACAQLQAFIGSWHLHIVGDGPLCPALRRQCYALGIHDRVTLHGALPHAELPDWFRAADLFVLASRSEGVPNVLLESMACGLPFVATSVGGIPEIAELGSCRLVPPDDPRGLTDAIVQQLVQPRQPGPGPRDRREAVHEIADFLQMCAS
jgi:glycosyltransferase involved in cell wall biosynthesis